MDEKLWRVTLEVPSRTPQYDVLNHRVSIEISVPGDELVVSREPTKHDDFNDVYITIGDAFDAAERQLQSYAGRLKDSRKPIDEPPHAIINKIFTDEGYGFLLTPDEREIYFHKNSVSHPGFNKLNEGDTVRFVESRGDKGPQASLVKVTGR
ncbi:MAG: cold shock domain-containing protein [Desulfuromonadaceae bacterium]|nr:cold shock domain-containing protein [Desulfuromonadaceae bacterium]